MNRSVTCSLTALTLLATSTVHGTEYGTCEEAMKAGEEGLFMWRVEESAQAYEAALQLAATDRERTQARLGQGNAIYFAGRYDEARAVYAEVLDTPRLHRDDAFFANQYTGHCYLQQQEFARALAAYRRGLDSRPSLRQNVVNDIYFAGMDAVNLGRRLYRLGRHDEDMWEMVVTTRAGTGGQNMWIYDNAYGPEKDVLERSLFTTPRITFIHPAHRQVRTIAARGRGGSTNAVLQHLRGEVAIDIAVEVLNGLELKKLTMDLIIPNVANLRSARTSYVKYRYVPGPDETQRLYEGPAAPEPGAVVLDTRKFPNGLYGLMVTAEDNRGVRCDQNTFFGIVNRKR